MSFTFSPMSVSDARLITEWRWPGFDPDRPWLRPSDANYSAHDAFGEVSAYCAFGPLSGFDSTTYVAVAGGIRPDMVGKGNGRAFMRAVIDLAHAEFANLTLIAVVKQENDHSMKSALGAGFVDFQEFGDGKAVLIDGTS
jgi:L-amino acid N-acyltransferase YncA